ncbi:hypothetical protein ACPCJU_15525 [Streptomyces thermodiastaticus]
MQKTRVTHLRASFGVLVAAALALSAGCSKGDDPDKRSARQVCGGISEQSAQALESVADTKDFTSTVNTSRFELPATLSDELDGKASAKRHLLCRIEPHNVINAQRIGITFEVLQEMPPPKDRRLKGNSHYKAGLRAEASNLGADIFFKCVRDGEVEGKAPIIKTSYSYWPPRGLIYQEGNMRLVNDIAYRLAQQLSCLKSSGLTPAMPPEE